MKFAVRPKVPVQVKSGDVYDCLQKVIYHSEGSKVGESFKFYFLSDSAIFSAIFHLISAFQNPVRCAHDTSLVDGF